MSAMRFKNNREIEGDQEDWTLTVFIIPLLTLRMMTYFEVKMKMFPTRTMINLMQMNCKRMLKKYLITTLLILSYHLRRLVSVIVIFFLRTRHVDL